MWTVALGPSVELRMGPRHVTCRLVKRPGKAPRCLEILTVWLTALATASLAAGGPPIRAVEGLRVEGRAERCGVLGKTIVGVP